LKKQIILENKSCISSLPTPALKASFNNYIKLDIPRDEIRSFGIIFLMKTFFLDTSNKSSAAFDLYLKRGRCEKLMVLIDGDGGNRLKLRPLAKFLFNEIQDSNIAAISFEQMETDMRFPAPKTQLLNLVEIISKIREIIKIKEINLVATSGGAISAVLVVVNKEDLGIKNVVLLDPTDYLLRDLTLPLGQTWDGNQKYPVDKKTFSSLLKGVRHDVKVHVINFTLRNCIDGKYGIDRGFDYPEGHSRLNNDMVRSFYIRTPDINKGIYIEDNKLPQAFLRDGKIKSNLNIIKKYIMDFI